MPKGVVIHDSSTGTNDAMARAFEEGARGAGAEVRRALVAENAPRAAIEQNPAWKSSVDRTANDPRATLADLEPAHAIAFGTPTRFGNGASPVKAFFGTTGGFSRRGRGRAQ